MRLDGDNNVCYARMRLSSDKIDKLSPSRFFSLCISLLVELFDAKLTGPGALGRGMYGGHQTVHVIATVTIITEQKLIIIIRSSAYGATLALDTLPSVLLH